MTRAADIAAALLAEPSRNGDSEPDQPQGMSLADGVAKLLVRADANRPVIETLKCPTLAMLPRLPRGEPVALISAPAAGKTLLADRMTYDSLVANPTARAITFSLETAPLVRIARLAAGLAVRLGAMGNIETCVPLNAILHGDLNAGGKFLLHQAAEQLQAIITPVNKQMTPQVAAA